MYSLRVSPLQTRYRPQRCAVAPCKNEPCPSAPSSNAEAVGGLRHRLARVESGREERRARPSDARKGPRGGGRDRDRIIRHTTRTESEDFAKQVGLRIPEGAALTPDALRQHREAYVGAMRAYNAGEVKRRMRSWTLPFLIRHSAFHTLDHAWEMEDKDLSAQDGA